MMWGPGPWLWGFWWIFPLTGLVLCVAFMAMMMRAMHGGRGFMCMGGHGHRGPDNGVNVEGADPHAELKREIRELRDEIRQLRASR
jgi:hypothetical protein